jgi:hypothetical protein
MCHIILEVGSGILSIQATLRLGPASGIERVGMNQHSSDGDETMLKIAVMVLAVILAFCCGFAAGNYKRKQLSTFDDMIVNHPHDFSALVTPGDQRVKNVAAELKTLQNAYLFVRDRITDEPSLPAMTAGEVISAGKAGCLGKAVLLCSLYRAMGIAAANVRVVAGEVDFPTGIVDHAWVDLELNGIDIQQDASNFLGKFGFDQFRGAVFTKTFIRDEEIVFNDRSFSIVSPLNILKGSGHPVIH